MKRNPPRIQFGTPDVDLPVFELDPRRIRSPEVRIGHEVILFDSSDRCEHAAACNLALKLNMDFLIDSTVT